MFEGQVELSQRLNLPYDDVARRYHVIASLPGAMTKRFVCKASGKGWRRNAKHTRSDMWLWRVRLLTHGGSNLVRGL